ncbi:MAG: N-acetylglucosamine repressor [Verrucomicrobiota bacterium]|jgi:glucokinase
MILAADFGGTIVKLGLLEKNDVLIYRQIKSPSSRNSAEWLPTIKNQVEEMCQSLVKKIGDLEGMVWAMPMVIDPGLRRASRTFGKFDDVLHEDFAQRAEAVFGLPLLLENDARAAALGEWQFGAGNGCDDVAMITLGTGIGTAIIQHGLPLRGRSGMAGNLGGLSITHLGTSDHHRVAPGCIEGFVASWAIPQRAADMPGFSRSSLSGCELIDYRTIFSHAEKGDLLSIELRELAIEAWSALALNLIQSFDPARVIVGGGIMASADAILPKMREFMQRHCIQCGGDVDIVPAQLGDQAALLGCEWIWNQEKIKALPVHPLSHPA